MARKAKGKYRRRGFRRRNMSKYIRGRFQIDQDLGTLAGNTGVRQAFPDVVVETVLCTSIVSTHVLTDITRQNNQGPLKVYVAHSDYSLAEIEAWIESTESWSKGNLIEQEIMNRKIKYLGAFVYGGGSATADQGMYAINDGRPKKTKLNWILRTGQTLAFVTYNSGSEALGTSDPDVHHSGHANLFET